MWRRLSEPILQPMRQQIFCLIKAMASISWICGKPIGMYLSLIQISWRKRKYNWLYYSWRQRDTQLFYADADMERLWLYRVCLRNKCTASLWIGKISETGTETSVTKVCYTGDKCNLQIFFHWECNYGQGRKLFSSVPVSRQMEKSKVQWSRRQCSIYLYELQQRLSLWRPNWWCRKQRIYEANGKDKAYYKNKSSLCEQYYQSL